MNTSLEFLPEYKQEELKLITELIVQKMQPAMVILFGSYARNTWAEEEKVEDGIRVIFKSDYDILVVTKEDLGNISSNMWRKTRQKLRKLDLSTSITAIQHSVRFINKELKAGGYFFTDVIKEGIVLYDSGAVTLENPGDIDPEEVRKRAEEDYEHWFKSALVFFKQFNYALNDSDLNEAAFLLHQSTERLYTALLLVFTGYKEKTHDLDELGKSAEVINKEFVTVFPMDSKEHIERYHLLKKAYIEARYKKSYSITKVDLEYLSGRVVVLKELVERVCKERLGE